jgi:diadenosine tetraphosphate (Ap4A) HIT family hydrolase
LEWPDEFYRMRRGESCPICNEGRPDETPFGIRIFAGMRCDAYLRRSAIQRGYTLVKWRGRHVAEPTELEPIEAAEYGREVLRVARALVQHFHPVKMNYNVLGNSVPHLHTHVIPRYAHDPRPGWPFPFPDPEPPDFPPEVLNADADALRKMLRDLSEYQALSERPADSF